MICIMFVGEWIVDYIYMSLALNSGLTGFQLYEERGIARVVKYPHANHQQTEQKILVFVV